MCAGFVASLSGDRSTVANIERRAGFRRDRAPVYPANAATVRPCAACQRRPSAVATYPATSNAANGKQNAAPHFGTRRNLSGKPWQPFAVLFSKTAIPISLRSIAFVIRR